jgi:hypothetical protein
MYPKGNTNEGSSGTMRAFARSRKRAREGNDLSPSLKSSLWEAIVKWDDISFKHVLPRLNSTDLKFLHLVNGETRKLIKRSSRKK